MTDREFLELAAKAARYEVVGLARAWIAQGVSDHALLIRNDRGGDSVFDPLNDDGDALRLAVKLKMQIDVDDSAVEVLTTMHRIVETTDGANDAASATRRAIVRAAAEIGRLQG